MKTQKILLAFALASSVTTIANANNVIIDTGLAFAMNALAAKTEGAALNLAVNTADVNASVNTAAGLNFINNISPTVNAIDTSAIGAVNTGDISLEQASNPATLASEVSGSVTAGSVTVVPFLLTGSVFSADYSSSLESSVDDAASNYGVSNVAYNSGDINASVNTIALLNRIDGIKTSAIGAAQTGSITVTVH
ncbi:hypothetical protein AVENLUH5627_02380 [Acinetobacter venetianus]|uniref:Protein FilA n=1 Tax=Acinetobacter venetianus TaxID=52133 RepID=A0A150HMC0_9GAMM|nr:hypothetical protein [Acinetobacter venetianus]KXZ66884.1 hypothetical protein AVENLUH5627_02380 [Acinetobacter venetianus]